MKMRLDTYLFLQCCLQKVHKRSYEYYNYEWCKLSTHGRVEHVFSVGLSFLWEERYYELVREFWFLLLCDHL